MEIGGDDEETLAVVPDEPETQGDDYPGQIDRQRDRQVDRQVGGDDKDKQDDFLKEICSLWSYGPNPGRMQLDRPFHC